MYTKNVRCVGDLVRLLPLSLSLCFQASRLELELFLSRLLLPVLSTSLPVSGRDKGKVKSKGEGKVKGKGKDKVRVKVKTRKR